MASHDKIRNVGPKSAAWLRQVGVRTLDDLRAIGPVEAFMKVRRAGFRPSLNLVYALEGALLDCHWQQVPDDRRSELLLAVDAADAVLQAARGRPVGAVTEYAGDHSPDRSGGDASDATDGGGAMDTLFDRADGGGSDD